MLKLWPYVRPSNGLEIRMFKKLQYSWGHGLGVVVSDGGCHYVGAMCARIEASND